MRFFFILGGGILLLFSVDCSFGFFGCFYKILPNSSLASEFLPVPLAHLPQKPQNIHKGKTDTWMHPFPSRSQGDSPQNKNQSLCCRNRLTSRHNNRAGESSPTLARAFHVSTAHLSRECQPSFLFIAEHF